jgi:hypothetical protein
MRRRVHQVRPALIEKSDAAARTPDENGDGPADLVENRGKIEARRDELTRPIERGQLLGTSLALIDETVLLDSGSEWPRDLHRDLDVPPIEGTDFARTQDHRPEDPGPRYQGHKESRPTLLGEKAPPAWVRSHVSGGNVVDPDRIALRHCASQEGAVEWESDDPAVRTLRRSREQIHAQRRVTVGVQQTYADRVEVDETGERVHGDGEDLFQRMSRATELGDTVENLNAEGAPVEPPDLFKGRTQLAREARWKWAQGHGPRGADKRDLSDLTDLTGAAW